MQIPLIKKFEAGYTAGAHALDAQHARADQVRRHHRRRIPAIRPRARAGACRVRAGRRHHLPRLGRDRPRRVPGGDQQNKLAIGVDSDQYDEAPGHVLTSMIKRVDVAVFDVIKDLKEGRWQGGVRTFGLGEDGVGWVYDARNQNLIPAP
jgi:basic membrane protein A